jgi:hypothetical protein
MMVRIDFYNGTTYVSRVTGSSSLSTSWQVVACSGVIRSGVDRIHFCINAQSLTVSVGNADFVVDSAVAIRSATGPAASSDAIPEIDLNMILLIAAVVCSTTALILVILHMLGKIDRIG